jgi:hypothetical protein
MSKVRPVFVVGPPSSGKSYYIKQLAAKESRVLLRCPCRKDRTLREQRAAIHEWALRAEPTLLWIEGADDLTPEAQSFLRRILETYAPSVRFCLEAQTLESIQEPILSRCEVIRLKPPTRDTLIAKMGTRYSPAIVQQLREVVSTHGWRQMEMGAHIATHFPEVWKTVIKHATSKHSITTPMMDLYVAAANPWSVIFGAFSQLDDESKRLVIDTFAENGNPWAVIGFIQARQSCVCN